MLLFENEMKSFGNWRNYPRPLNIFNGTELTVSPFVSNLGRGRKRHWPQEDVTNRNGTIFLFFFRYIVQLVRGWKNWHSTSGFKLHARIVRRNNAENKLCFRLFRDLSTLRRNKYRFYRYVRNSYFKNRKFTQLGRPALFTHVFIFCLSTLVRIAVVVKRLGEGCVGNFAKTFTNIAFANIV